MVFVHGGDARKVPHGSDGRSIIRVCLHVVPVDEFYGASLDLARAAIRKYIVLAGNGARGRRLQSSYIDLPRCRIVGSESLYASTRRAYRVVLIAYGMV